jgi:hypothetical protein
MMGLITCFPFLSESKRGWVMWLHPFDCIWINLLIIGGLISGGIFTSVPFPNKCAKSPSTTFSITGEKI